MRLASESGKDIVGVVVVIISWPTFPLPLMMDIVRRARTAPRPSQRPASPRPLSIYLAIRDSQPPEISCFFILNIFDEVRVGHLTLSLMFNKIKDQGLEPLSTSSIDASVRPRATYDDLLLLVLVHQSLLRMMIRMDDVTNHRKRGRKEGLPRAPKPNRLLARGHKLRGLRAIFCRGSEEEILFGRVKSERALYANFLLAVVLEGIDNAECG